MSYKKQNFTNGQTLTAEMLNRIEDGIVAISTVAKGDTGPAGPKGDKGDAGERGHQRHGIHQHHRAALAVLGGTVQGRTEGCRLHHLNVRPERVRAGHKSGV